MRFDHSDYQSDYKALQSAFIPVDTKTHEKLVAVCQKNLWLRKGGIPFGDDPFFEMDSPYSFRRIDDPEMLEAFFDHGNWSIRQGILHRDLVFINQVNGGDEWWTLKKDGDSYLPFESITFHRIIETGRFQKYMNRLHRATPQQCKDLAY